MFAKIDLQPHFAWRFFLYYYKFKGVIWHWGWKFYLDILVLEVLNSIFLFHFCHKRLTIPTRIFCPELVWWDTSRVLESFVTWVFWGFEWVISNTFMFWISNFKHISLISLVFVDDQGLQWYWCSSFFCWMSR